MRVSQMSVEAMATPSLPRPPLNGLPAADRTFPRECHPSKPGGCEPSQAPHTQTKGKGKGEGEGKGRAG